MRNLCMIACVSKDLGLGKDNALLWNLKPDMAFFRETTSNHTVVMGRNTFLSIGRPLPNRENLILSHTIPDEVPEQTKYFSDKASLDAYLETIEGEKFIIGGASLYKLYLPEAEKIYLTEVNAVRPADVYFPEFDHSRYERRVLKTDKVDDIEFKIVEYIKND